VHHRPKGALAISALARVVRVSVSVVLILNLIFDYRWPGRKVGAHSLVGDRSWAALGSPHVQASS
jgi:hypothetical protein